MDVLQLAGKDLLRKVREAHSKHERLHRLIYTHSLDEEAPEPCDQITLESPMGTPRTDQTLRYLSSLQKFHCSLTAGFGHISWLGESTIQ